MYKVVIIGGGWSGCAAALAARKAGAEVTLLEKTDLLLGLGNVGGIMRNNGRFTAAEENIALGARELFDITDRCSRHVNIDFPGHKHASLYDVMKVEPAVRRLLREKGIEVRLMARAVDVVRQRNCRGRRIAVPEQLVHPKVPVKRSSKNSFWPMVLRVPECIPQLPGSQNTPRRSRSSRAMSSSKRRDPQVRWVTALHTATGAACVCFGARHLAPGSVSVQEPAAAISWAAGGMDPSELLAAAEN